jgi:RimJ/RimL family protein N-acetyltransferase
MQLETERLVLRKPELGDLDGYVELWGDPEVMRFLGGHTLPPEEVPQAMQRNLGQWDRHGLGLFSVLRKEDERFASSGESAISCGTPTVGRTRSALSSRAIWSSRSAGPS